MEIWEIYKEELQKYREELENDNNEVEQNVVDLEMKIEEGIAMNMGHKNSVNFQKLLKELKSLKKEFDFYDEEAELDMMFPNRNGDDFDEDSMNYENVFGDD